MTENPWREVLIDELVVDHIYTAAHDSDPKKALNDAIAWNVMVALDPCVSQAARDLVAQARREAIEECARVADETRARFGSPVGTAYDNGLWDQSVRIATEIRARL